MPRSAPCRRSAWPSWPGVNAAKVRKDLSYLGSYGTRGVGLRRRVPAARDLPRARPHPRLAGRDRRHRQPRPGARQLPRLRRPGLPGRGARRRRPRQGRQAGRRASPIESLDDLAARRRERGVAIGIIATPGRTRPRRWRTGWSTPACRSILNFAPTVVTRAAGRVAAQGRPRDRAADPLLLPAAPPERSGNGAAVPGRGPAPGRWTPAQPHHRATRSTSSSTGRRCVVVGGGRSRPARSRRCSRPAPTCTWSPPRSATRCARWADAGRLTVDERRVRGRRPRRRLARHDRHRRSRRSTEAVFDAGEARRMWVNSADDPANCSFTLMSVVRQGDLVVDRSAPAAAARRWPPGCSDGSATSSAPSTRSCSTCSPRPGRRSAAEGRSSEDADWQRALDSGMLDLIRAGRIDEAKELLAGMSLVVVGLNHRTVPVELLERLAVAPDDLPKALQALMRREHLAEVVLLSTCNRTEVYAHATLFHPAMQDVRDFLADQSGVDPDEFADLLYTYYDDAAVAHLFARRRRARLDDHRRGRDPRSGARGVADRRARVASGHAARSRRSATRSRSASAPAPRPASGATRCRCRRPRSRSPTEKLGSLDGRRVLVLGAGEMGEGMALALAGAGVARDRRRQPHRCAAQELAERVGGRAVPLDEVADALRRVRRAARVDRRARRARRARARRAGDGRARRAGAARRRRRRAARRRPRRAARCSA